MARPRSTKRDIERAKREKTQEKQARRPARIEASRGPGETVSDAAQADVLESLRVLHERYDDGDLDFDAFDEAKQELLARLSTE